MRFSLALLVLACIATPSQAALVIRAAPGTFVQGTDFGTIDVFISSDNNDAVSSLIAEFLLPDGGDFDDPPGVFGETEAGFFGFGNLNSSSVFQRSAAGVADLSLDLDTGTAPPADEILLARATVLLSGLAVGEYAFNLSNVSAFDANANPITVFATDGTISIVAIPEPSSVSLLLVGCAATVLSRRRRA